jgi:hypothetical protein
MGGGSSGSALAGAPPPACSPASKPRVKSVTGGVVGGVGGVMWDADAFGGLGGEETPPKLLGIPVGGGIRNPPLLNGIAGGEAAGAIGGTKPGDGAGGV